jgi:hypothetical protein
MATVSKKGSKDTVSYFSRAKELFSGLLELSASNRAVLLGAAGLTGSGAYAVTPYIPNPFPASQIIGEMSS